MLQQGMTNSFLYELATGGQNLSTDTLKMALYVSTADLGPTTTAYTTSGEVATGAGYTAGGVTLTGVTLTQDASTGTVYLSFNNPEWDAASFTTRGGLIYNSTQSNKSVAVLDFGDDKNAGGRTFRVTVPGNSPTTALIRLVRGQ